MSEPKTLVTLFTDAEAPMSLLALADEWCDRTAPDDVARLNVRGFAIWADLRRKSTPTPPACPSCGHKWSIRACEQCGHQWDES